jgi:hypothetical protein
MQPYFVVGLVRDNGVLRPINEGFEWPERALEVLRGYAGCDLHIYWSHLDYNAMIAGCIWALIDGEVVHTYAFGNPSSTVVVIPTAPDQYVSDHNTPANAVLDGHVSGNTEPDHYVPNNIVLSYRAGTWSTYELPLNCVQVWNEEYGITKKMGSYSLWTPNSL